ncbi:peptidoglycan-binding domain-containing protein [Streptomyces sp. bgisy100]|uniref:peptidoglycan-binding domain-containing protein n=1 Tax=Streptomyces sp. bgisy100 TaxID=3413783 RepID=UPI003D70A439
MRKATRRTRIVAAGAAVTAVAAVVAVGIAGTGGGAEPQRRDGPAATTRITRQTLTDATTVDGELGYGPTTPVASRAGGTVTWLPAVGSTVTRGAPLLRADDRPVPLLYGALPMYRELRTGSRGRDVLQFERNLAALGYVGFDADERYTAFTAAAVKRWQARLGLRRTGSVAVGQVVYAPGPVRIAGHTARVGGSADTEVLTCTGTERVVTAEVRVLDAGWAVRGAKVRVELENGRTVRGTVTGTGSDDGSDEGSQDGAQGGSRNGTDGNSSGGSGGSGGSGSGSSGSGGGSGGGGSGGGGSGGAGGGGSGSSGTGGDATVRITVSVAAQQALRGPEHAPVGIRFTADRRAGALTVPVAALLALAEGGYGLELVEPGRNGAPPRTRIAPVRTGLFAEGRVEVRGEGIRAGRRVGMPG